MFKIFFLVSKCIQVDKQQWSSALNLLSAINKNYINLESLQCVHPV